MNALQIVQQVTGELALTQPSALVLSTDMQVVQMLAFLNRLGTDIVTQFEWEKLDREYILTTVATTTTGNTTDGSTVITGIPSTSGLSALYAVSGVGVPPFAQIVSVDSATQVTVTMPMEATGTAVALTFAKVQYALPSDWQKQIPQTEWDRTNRWPLMGPQTPQDWQSFKSGVVYSGPRQRFRIQGGYMTINPLPPDGLVFAFEYISNAWVRSVAGASQTSIAADTDTFIFSDSLLVTGLKSQWLQAKGLDNSYALQEFKNILGLAKSQDKSAPMLSLSPYRGTVLLTEYNIPDGNYPG